MDDLDPRLGLPASGHEETDVSISPILITGAGLALTLAIVAVVIYVVFGYLSEHPLTSARVNPMADADRQIPPAPRVEEHPAIEIRELHTEENSILSTYGWTDKEEGIVRVPIDR